VLCFDCALVVVLIIENNNNNNDDNNKIMWHNNRRICIAPRGRNFRGAGARQCAAEEREERKPGRRGMSLA